MKKRRTIAVVVAICLVFTMMGSGKDSNAAASKKALKFLKGTWRTVSSLPEKVVFTQKYMKVYEGYNKDHTGALPGKKKGNLLAKLKIKSTKEKGKNWVIKVKSAHTLVYYGSGDGLFLKWKENGEWIHSTTDSLQRI